MGRGTGRSPVEGALRRARCLRRAPSTTLRAVPLPVPGKTFAPPRRIALAFSRTHERSGEFLAHLGEIALDAAFAADQHMVVVGQALLRQRGAEQLAEAALHPVSDHRVADL